MKTFEKLTAANFPLVLEARGTKVTAIGKKKCSQIFKFLDENARYRIVGSKIAFLMRLAGMENIDDEKFWAHSFDCKKNFEVLLNKELTQLHLFATTFCEAIQITISEPASGSVNYNTGHISVGQSPSHTCIALPDGTFKLCCKFEGTNILRYSNEVEAKARLFPVPSCWRLVAIAFGKTR